MQPIFSNNPADWTKVEGLSISTTQAPPGIKGINLNQVGFAGQCVRGPKDKPVVCSSETRFEEVFGGRDNGVGGPLAGHVWRALLNKPFGPVVVVRVVAHDAVTASKNLTQATAPWTQQITFDTQANTANGDTLVIDDGHNPPATFEFRKDGNPAGAGHFLIDISGAASAQDVATAAINNLSGVNSLVNNNTLRLNTVAAPIAGVIHLVASVLGAAGNVTVTSHGHFTLGAPTNGVDTAVVRVDANGPGTWPNSGRLQLAVEAASDGDGTHWNLHTNYLGKDKVFENLNTQAGTDNTLAVLGDDDGNLVVLTKLADGRPDNVALANIDSGTAGADGTIADTDYTASGRGMNLLKAYKGVAICKVVGRSNTTVKTFAKTIAATAVDRVWIVEPDNETVSLATAEAEAENLLTGGQGRVIYCFNHARTLDPQTGTKIWTEPGDWMASILSQVDVDIHPGEESTKVFTAGIVELFNESLERNDYAAARAAGICALEKDEGFAFVSGVTTDGVEIADRREIDFLNLSVADRTKHMAKKKNTATNRKALVAPIDDFFTELVEEERVLEAFQVDGSVLNTQLTQGQNIQKTLIRGRLISHMNFLVNETEFGTEVVIGK